MAHYGSLDLNTRTSLTTLLAERGIKVSRRNQQAIEAGENLADAIASAIAGVKMLAAKVAAPIKEWRRSLQTREELMALDDRTLADIGLTRRDIPRLAAGLWSGERISVKTVTNSTVRAAASNVNKPQAVA
jgi:uncharacterized protein YjiS (DUF1127 family)